VNAEDRPRVADFPAKSAFQWENRLPSRANGEMPSLGTAVEHVVDASHRVLLDRRSGECRGADLRHRVLT